MPIQPISHHNPPPTPDPPIRRHVKSIQITVPPNGPPTVAFERHVPICHPDFLYLRHVERQYHPSPGLLNELFHIASRNDIRCYHSWLDTGWLGIRYYIDHPVYTGQAAKAPHETTA